MDIENIDSKQLSGAYGALVSSKEEVLIIEMDRKEAEQKIKEEIAMKNQYYKKDGTTLDLGKVKLPTFKKAMAIYLDGGPNKLEEELELQEQYIVDMKNDNTVRDRAKSLQNKMIQESESKGAAKDTKEELKAHLDSEVVEALNILADLEIKNKKEAMEADEGKETKKKKDNTEILDLVKKLKQKLGLI
jgi:hypothetical protein